MTSRWPRIWHRGKFFCGCWSRIRDRKAWHSSFSGWLYRIAHNLVIDHYRRRGRQSAIDIEEAPPMASDLEDPMETAEMNLDASVSAQRSGA